MRYINTITITILHSIESVATSYQHRKYNSMSCSIAISIPISLCQKDVSKHLHTTSVTDISTEYDLILARAGVFEYDEGYISRTTVAPISAQWRMIPETGVLLPRPHRQSQARS